MINGFDLLASFYDRLAKLVFGNNIKKAQCEFIEQIEEGSYILILGGGTGWILNEIFNRKNSVKIVYVDTSLEMIKKAKLTLEENWSSQVIFVNDTYQNTITKTPFDVIFTPFFLDMFNDVEVSNIIIELSKNFRTNGIWINTDFRNTRKINQKLLLKIMYLFFRAVCKIAACKLPNFEKNFYHNGFKKVTSTFFNGGIIESSIYKKIEND
ncbi:MAG: class I SAM-dependent methyltransferase [Cyclobacteriaceae bacterium]|nr:class I SAM-dependent methyltransferase [Cyclobacteriaceae bacterium]